MTDECFLSRHKAAAGLILAVFALAICGRADAAIVTPKITFNDLGDSITATTVGLSMAEDTVVNCVSISETCVVSGTLPSDEDVPFGTKITNINIYEPNGRAVSDTLTITTTRARPAFSKTLAIDSDSTFKAVFTSDSGFGLTLLAVNLVDDDKLIENGKAIKAFETGGLTFRVASDISDVPEPSAIALLGTGVAGFCLLGLYRRRCAS